MCFPRGSRGLLDSRSPPVSVCLICHAVTLLRATVWKARKRGAFGGTLAGFKLAWSVAGSNCIESQPRCLLNQSFYTTLLAASDWSTDGAPTLTEPIRALPWGPEPARAPVCSSFRKLGWEKESSVILWAQRDLRAVLVCSGCHNNL